MPHIKKLLLIIDNNNAIRIDNSGKHPTLTITNLDKLVTPPTLTLLSEQIARLLPQVDLTELILEIHARTGFLDEFTGTLIYREPDAVVPQVRFWGGFGRSDLAILLNHNPV